MSEGDNSAEAPTRRSRAWLIGIAAFALTFGLGVLWSISPDKAAPTAQVTEQRATRDEGERIEIPTLGISAVRPPGWAIVTADENSANIRSVQMDDRQYQELAARYANSPVIAISKYQEPYADLNPSFKINVRPIGAFGKFSPEDILTAALPTFLRAFNDARVVEGPRSARVANRTAAYARIAYTLRTKDVAVPTISEVWIVPKGSLFFMIGAGTRADEKNGSRAEMRRILETVRFD